MPLPLWDWGTVQNHMEENIAWNHRVWVGPVVWQAIVCFKDGVFHSRVAAALFRKIPI